MTTKTIKIPDATHPISIEPNPAHIVVKVAGKVVADTKDSLTLHESTYPPVIYIPRVDVDMALLQKTQTESYCPYKGECSYYSIPDGGERSVDAVWSYEAPYDSVIAIKDHVAFYTNRVDAFVES